MRPASIVHALVLSFVFSLSHAQAVEQKTSLPFRLASGDTVMIGRLDSADVLFFSLNDFLKSMQFPTVINDSTGKIEGLITLQLVRFTDRNPFVVITERTTNTAVIYQMPNKVVRRHSEFFVPAPAFIPLFERITEQRLSLDSMGTMLSLENPIEAKTSITGIQIENKINGSLITIRSNNRLGDFEQWLKPDGWLFVTIMGAKADTEALNATKPFGAVRKVIAIQSPTSLQLTFQVTSDVVQAQAETANDPASNNILISLRTLSPGEKEALKKKKQDTIKQQIQNRRDRWKLDVIVIDAGHGGRDPGCIGVVGTREKNVTLGAALKLGHLIEKNLKGVKVVYTRSSDKFVELYKRTQIANEAGGKLFISIHCNSLPHKPSRTNGFEIYLLRPGRTEEAVAIASRENSVIQLEDDKERYQKLTGEEFIIVTMAQSAYMKQSEQFAQSAANAMAKQLRIKNSGIKQAGFFVLVGASMPNVLVELGYLSNRNEEQFLRSENGQSKIADALLRGIKEYRLTYEQSLQEGIDNK